MIPLQELIRLNPTSVVITTKEAAAYDPSAVGDFLQEDAGVYPVVGAMSYVKKAEDQFDAKLSIMAADMPAGFSDQNSRVVAQSGDYGVKRLRPRYLFGAVVGYTLELEL